MPLTDLEVEFLTAARLPNGGLIDISCYLSRHEQNASGIIEVVEQSTNQRIGFNEAEQQVRTRPDRRSAVFVCGDCDQVHELFGHHADRVDNQSHLHADNGGAILLDPKIRPIKSFNSADYWRQRISSSIDMKFPTLPEEIDPELMLYIHLPCGQARALKLMAWDSVLAGCYGKRVMKRIARQRREERQAGRSIGRPFRTALLMHVDYGDRKRTYYVKRHLITPIAIRFKQLHTEQIDQLRATAATNS